MRLSILALSFSAFLVGCGGSSSNNNNYSASDVKQEQWERIIPTCPDNMSCSKLTVPKDYYQTDGDTVDIHYAVHKASDAENRIGILMINFGGPGAEAVQGASSMIKHAFPDEILQHFDIVALDPRGTGESAFATELTDCAIAIKNQTGDCATTYLDVAPYMGSNTVVKDMDKLREALGEEKISFFSYSYGTRLGSLYAQLFPENVRAIVLDSPMPPASDNYLALQKASTKGYDLITDYRLNFNTQQKQSYEKVVKTFYQNTTYTGNDDFYLNMTGIASTLNNTVSREEWGYWNKMNTGLIELLDNNNVALLVEQLNAIQYPAQTADDLRMNQVFKAVVCTDESVQLSQAEVDSSLSAFEQQSMIYGLYMRNSAAMCVDWQAKRDPIDYVESMQNVLSGQQILIIGGQYDTATPYQWATEMAESFGDLASVITVNNLVSHAFSYTKHTCVDEQTTNYLLDPTVKIADTSCDASTTKQRKVSKNFKHPAQQNPQGTF